MFKTVTCVPARTSLTPRYSVLRSACPDLWISAAGILFLTRSAVLHLVGFLCLVEMTHNPLWKSGERLTSVSWMQHTWIAWCFRKCCSTVFLSWTPAVFYWAILSGCWPFALLCHGQTRGVRVAVSRWGWAPLRLGARLGARHCPSWPRSRRTTPHHSKDSCTAIVL